MKGNPGVRSCNDAMRRSGYRRRILILIVLILTISGISHFIIGNEHHFALRSSSVVSSSHVGQQCDFFLAESSIPRGGLGVFTSKPLEKGSAAQPWPDICLYLTDASSKKGTEINTHSWQEYRFGAQWLGGRRSVRATCMGLVTIFNSMGIKKYASARPAADPLLIHTNGGLDRSKDPGAGAITQYYGATSETTRDLVAGSELMLWDTEHGGDQYKLDALKEDGRQHLNIETVPPPIRTPQWLEKHGMCLDNLIVKTANDPSMGRGAFANRLLPKGTVVAPAPLQIYPTRSKFSVSMSDEDRQEFESNHKMKYETEQLFVNYCFQPEGSTLLLYPYGAGVGLINHSSDKSKINVILRWSNNHMNHSPQWLDPTLSLDQFWKMQYPGALILDVVAIRKIREGEEIFMDYGPKWEKAWNNHLQKWKPDITATKNYVYPWDEMKRHGIIEKNEQQQQQQQQQQHKSLKPFRTLTEQERSPYPHNLMNI
mmetsp:Transcript_7321/g.8500  ORF Transcript_7321/g.8500 Transcript_7321/m.8500 type:complete len:485 (+) Transcript_7321:131-1585(+)